MREAAYTAPSAEPRGRYNPSNLLALFVLSAEMLILLRCQHRRDKLCGFPVNEVFSLRWERVCIYLKKDCTCEGQVFQAHLTLHCLGQKGFVQVRFRATEYSRDNTWWAEKIIIPVSNLEKLKKISGKNDQNDTKRWLVQLDKYVWRSSQELTVRYWSIQRISKK